MFAGCAGIGVSLAHRDQRDEPATDAGREAAEKKVPEIEAPGSAGDRFELVLGQLTGRRPGGCQDFGGRDLESPAVRNPGNSLGGQNRALVPVRHKLALNGGVGCGELSKGFEIGFHFLILVGLALVLSAADF